MDVKIFTRLHQFYRILKRGSSTNRYQKRVSIVIHRSQHATHDETLRHTENLRRKERKCCYLIPIACPYHQLDALSTVKGSSVFGVMFLHLFIACLVPHEISRFSLCPTLSYQPLLPEHIHIMCIGIGCCSLPALTLPQLLPILDGF